MRTMPQKCREVDEAGAFCDCIAGDSSVDKAAQAFCRRPGSPDDRKSSGDELRELKKALMDLEDE